ncbi:MAG: mechanosensitive ion channel family protein [Bacteroidota bacterium]
MRLIFTYLFLFPLLLWSQNDPASIDSLNQESVDSLASSNEEEASKPMLLMIGELKSQMDSLLNVQTRAAKAETKPKEESVKDVTKNVQENVNETLTTFKDIFSFSRIISIVLIMFFVWLFLKILDWFFVYLVDRFNRHRLKILRVQPVVRVLVWIVASWVVVNTLFDLSPTTIMTFMTTSAVALGFAAQDILKNIFGGLLILFDRPFQIGDRIQVKEKYGEVKNIGLRTTQINTLDDSMVTIPNSSIVSESVSNANSGALDCMVVVDLWLPIDINVEKARKIALEAAITSRYLNIDKPVVILFFDHIEHAPATNVKIKAYVLDARYEKAFAGDVTEAAKKAFKEVGLYSGLTA